MSNQLDDLATAVSHLQDAVSAAFTRVAAHNDLSAHIAAVEMAVAQINTLALDVAPVSVAPAEPDVTEPTPMPEVAVEPPAAITPDVPPEGAPVVTDATPEHTTDYPVPDPMP